MTANPDMNALYATGEPALIGAISAVTSQKKTDKVKVFGWDLTAQAIKGIDEGWIVAVVQQDPFQEGVAGVETILKLEEGREGQSVDRHSRDHRHQGERRQVSAACSSRQTDRAPNGVRPQLSELGTPANVAERRADPSADGGHQQVVRRDQVARPGEPDAARRRGARPRRRQRRRQVDFEQDAFGRARSGFRAHRSRRTGGALRVAGRRAARARRDGLSRPVALRHGRRSRKLAARPRTDAPHPRRAADGQAQDARRGRANARASRHPHAEHASSRSRTCRAASARASPSAAPYPSIRSSSSWTSRPRLSRSPKSTRFST